MIFIKYNDVLFNLERFVKNINLGDYLASLFKNQRDYYKIVKILNKLTLFSWEKEYGYYLTCTGNYIEKTIHKYLDLEKVSIDKYKLFCITTLSRYLAGDYYASYINIDITVDNIDDYINNNEELRLQYLMVADNLYSFNLIRDILFFYYILKILCNHSQYSFYNIQDNCLHITNLNMFGNINSVSKNKSLSLNLQIYKDLKSVIISEDISIIPSLRVDNVNDIAFILPKSTCEVSSNFLEKFRGTINLEELTSLASIKTSAFEDIHFTDTTVTLPNSIIDLGESSFYGSNIEVINLPNKIVSLPNLTFSSCLYLYQVNSTVLKSIGDCAFFNCERLMNINLQYVEKIGDCAFANCRKLNELNLSSIIQISYCAFINCINLYKIILSPNITSIDNKAFLNCKNLQEIYVNCPITNINYLCVLSYNQIGDIQISSPNDLINITVPSDVFENCERLEILDYSYTDL